MSNKIDLTKPFCFKPESEEQVKKFLELVRDKKGMKISEDLSSYRWNSCGLWGVDFGLTTLTYKNTLLFGDDTKLVTFQQILDTFEEEKPMSDLFGKKYRVNPETSERLQQLVFEDGGEWKSKGRVIGRAPYGFLFVSSSGELTYTDDEECFLSSRLPEFSLEGVKTLKLTEVVTETVEIDGIAYYKEDIEKLTPAKVN